MAALLLRDQGFEVIGVTMRLWSVDDANLPPLNKRCCSVEDVDDARRVCQMIGVPHYVQNFEREFQTHVVDYFVREYEQGRTPHPCMPCNEKIKFDFLLGRALFLEADYIATGHYARIRPSGDGFRLLKGADASKDQSYVLYTLSQQQLGRLLLPVGEYPKDEIRELAARAGLPVADKPDSQEICFIPSGDYRKFVEERSKPRPGNFVDTGGAVLGQHPGIQFFTVGQRRKLGLNGNSGNPMYVARIDAESNEVVLSARDDLYSSVLTASNLSFTSGETPVGPVEVMAKIRYKANEAPATLSAQGDRGELRLHEPVWAVTPGQPVVFYQGEEVVGGGIIEQDARLS